MITVYYVGWALMFAWLSITAYRKRDTLSPEVRDQQAALSATCAFLSLFWPVMLPLKLMGYKPKKS